MLLRYTDSDPARMRLCCAYSGGQLFPSQGVLSHMQLPLQSHPLSRPSHKESVCCVLHNRSRRVTTSRLAGCGAAARNTTVHIHDNMVERMFLRSHKIGDFLLFFPLK
jgi:hypothetical protein